MTTREQIPMKPAAAPVLQPPTPAPFATLQRKCACGGSGHSGGDCPECKKKKLQRAARGTGSLPVSSHGQDGHATVPPIVHDVLRSPGQPLDAATRAFFEPRFGHDFSRVRVHADSRAAASAAAVNAHAYTLGSEVTFGAGEYAPRTDRGRGLLAHELAHVIQQSASPNAPSADLRVGPPGDAAEQEADRFAEKVIRSEPQPADVLWHGHPGHDLTRAGRPCHPSGANLKVAANAASEVSTDRSPAMLRRRVIVNPPAAAPDILRQFNTICPGGFSVTGPNITEHCISSSQGCESLCDVARDPSRTYTINVRPAVVGTELKAMHDNTTAPVPTVSVWPETAPGPNPTVTMVAAGSPVEFGSFAPDGHAEWAEDWRILEHELCGHARLGGGDGPIGNRPNHDTTIDTENAIAAEHGRPARGHYTDRRQGESFFNPAGNRSKVKFIQVDGHHYEAP